MALAYDIGDRVELRAAFRNAAGAFADPTEVTYTVKGPSGSLTTYTYGGATVTKLATGRYQVFVTPNASGSWHWRAVGSGAVVDVTEGAFDVRKSEVVDG